jgi:hypothetical protein
METDKRRRGSEGWRQIKGGEGVRDGDRLKEERE